MNKKNITKQDVIDILNNENFYKNNILDLKSLDQVEEIESFAFSGIKKNLHKVILPPNLKRIGQSAFMYNKIKQIVWNDKIEHISFACFESNYLEVLQIPSSIKVIEESAFAMNSIKTLHIPSFLTTLENDLFYNNKIEELIIEDFKNKEIKNAFFNNDNIKNIVLKSNFRLLEDTNKYDYKKMIFYFLDHFSDYENEVKMTVDNLKLSNFLKSLVIDNVQKLTIENNNSKSVEVLEFYVEKMDLDTKLEFKLISKKDLKTSLKIV
ncbi:leucine-rich repeat domain-containing protein [Mycoplasma sp. 1654_15]|uniref:leucine-rich repeat domain-containing protein n=1 Tax=Mycoplasma sp. 1654_15 TaxID=2725994 RepID=UPI001448FAD7|nr:leucine-rich repeat domain-containing protein [Mycoplasma sp. 1654_15]QJB71102.1 leucine-rich repeat domain-containing protein [Mycoplasma sp. 1654_15]